MSQALIDPQAIWPDATDEEIANGIPVAGMVEKPSIWRPFSDAMIQLPPVQWMVEGLLMPNTINTFYGSPGCKKTWAMMDLAVCVASGKSWLNKATSKAPVLWVDEDMGKRGFTDRLKMLQKGHSVATDLPLHWVSGGNFKANQYKFGTASEYVKTINDIADGVIATGAKLVIIDNLGAVTDGNYSDNAYMAPVMSDFRRLVSEYDVAVIFISHALKFSKDVENKFIGGTVLHAGCNLMVEISSKNDSKEIEFKSTKNRDMEAFSFVAQADFGDDTFSLAESTRSPKWARLSGTEEIVLRYLSGQGPTPWDKIAGEAPDGISSDSIRRRCIDLEKQKYLVANEKDGKKYLYSLTGKGLNYVQNNL